MTSKTATSLSLFDMALVRPALWGAFAKLNPRLQWRNPVIFIVYVGSILTTLLWFHSLSFPVDTGMAPGFVLAITVRLWFTVLFVNLANLANLANFAEALAQGRSKAQAASLRGLRKDTWAKQLDGPHRDAGFVPEQAPNLRKGDVVLLESGDVIPLDGEVIEGVASVDESAITGESAPVVRQPGGDFSAVTGGTRVLSDWLVNRISVNPGESFLDRMIGMVAAARRQAPEAAERSRAHHPAGRAHAGVPHGQRHVVAVLSVQRRRGRDRHGGLAHRPGRIAGVPDPDHHRRLAVGRRRGRHEPDDAGQRDRRLGSRG